ncbi:MAG: endonuclease/exonuclease/phosphatase family protein [FCB group bacterium]|nr:endonuclease/exonuclease/phosphatase family protein [FCB group bacterium]
MSNHKWTIIAQLLVFGPMVTVAITVLLNSRTGSETDLGKSAQLTTPPAALSEPIDLRIVTFNLHDLYLDSADRPARMRGVGAVLAELDPDIVGIQEAFIASDRRVLLDDLAAKNSRLAHHQYFPSATVGSGLLVLSAFPLTECFFHRYRHDGKWYRFQHGDWWAGKGVALARVQLPSGGYLDFYNTHLHAQYGRGEYVTVIENEALEIGRFVKASATGVSPAIVVGDFNCTPDSNAYGLAVSEAGLKRMMLQDTRIDHIFAVDNPRYAFTALETIRIDRKVKIGDREERLSDHTGYLSAIRIAPAKQEDSVADVPGK